MGVCGGNKNEKLQVIQKRWNIKEFQGEDHNKRFKEVREGVAECSINTSRARSNLPTDNL